MFITFEGADGVGKTTQMELLRERLEAQGQEVLLTREPGGSPIAEKIRGLLLDRENDMDDMTEAYLYAAARADHVRRVILPALARGCVVLCDRYVDSSLAYQGFGREIGAQAVWEINRQAVGRCMPYRTYLMALGRQEAERRVRARGEMDRMESAGRAFAQRVDEGFALLAQRAPERIMVLDAAQTKEVLARLIAEDVAKLKTCPPDGR